jgi:transcriptional regulator with XRE-family HTH domain
MTAPRPPARCRLDVAALYSALDIVRSHRRCSWREVAAETGLSPSLFSRLAEGRKPDADGLVTLLAWLGRVDALLPFLAVHTGDDVPDACIVDGEDPL